ncbi:prepilin peptidase [Actinokineospora enzanensis]|uniref:prepilin peptidase n=1 Tax=Actinokineospora enzanensis TaxID=155975 RepID=UPI00039F0720|nr:A24 family peptidase [Actinokineospora enzanensis]
MRNRLAVLPVRRIVALCLPLLPAGYAVPVLLPRGLGVSIGVAAMFGALSGCGAGALVRRFLDRADPSLAVGPGWYELPAALLGGFACALTACGVVPAWWLPAVLFLVWVAVPLAVIDLRHRRLPNLLTLPAFPVGLALLAVAAALGPGVGLLWNALVGVVAFGGLHVLIHRWFPGELGMGDVKLSFTLGAYLGAVGPWALVVAPLLAAAVTLALHLVRHPRWHDGVPHGPGLLAATYTLSLPAFPLVPT